MADVIAMLTDKNAKAACACAGQMAEESRVSDRWYRNIGEIAALLEHGNSLVRNRAIMIIAANARWDTEGLYDGILDSLLAHITDEKPITARQCIKALPEIGNARPELAPRIRAALQNADTSGYRDSMRPLIIGDIVTALELLP